MERMIEGHERMKRREGKKKTSFLIEDHKRWSYYEWIHGVSEIYKYKLSTPNLISSSFCISEKHAVYFDFQKYERKRYKTNR